MRVAIKSDVGYTFGRVVGLGSAVVGGQARVATKGDLLPIAVRHYINAPGPFAGAVAPCDGNPNHFQDLIATADTSCLGSMTDASPRSVPNPGAPFNASAPDDDPVNHGPIIALVGQGAVAVQRGQLPRVRRARHPQFPVPVAAFERPTTTA